MDIFEFAIEKEQLAEQYYRELAQKTSNKGFTNIFNMLAEEEIKHQQIMTKMKQDMPYDVAETPVVANAKKEFEKMREATDQFNFDINEKQLYEKAREIEANSRDYYTEKANEVQEDWKKEIFHKLAAEEDKHYKLVDSICILLERPDTWLEDAEFYHLEDY